MKIIEKTICRLMNSLFNITGNNNIDARKKAQITKSVLGFVGFIIETSIIIAISLMSKTFINSLIFIFVFGAVRIGSAEHYKYWLKCLTGTTLIYTFTLIMWLYFSYNIFTDIIWIIGVSLYFRK